DAAPAIDLEHVAGEEGGLLGGQEQRRVGHVVDGCEPAERHCCLELRAQLGRIPAMKVGNSGVSAITGAIAQTRMPSGASSAAIDLEPSFPAPLEALSQVNPGRGRIPAVEPILMITPDFCLRMRGTTACANRKIDLTLTAMSRSNSASSTSSMGRRTW